MGFDVCLSRSGKRGEGCREVRRLQRREKRDGCREERLQRRRLRRRSRTPFGTRVRTPSCPAILPARVLDDPSSSKLESNTECESRTSEVARTAELQPGDQCCSHLSETTRDILLPYFSLLFQFLLLISARHCWCTILNPGPCLCMRLAHKYRP